MIDPPGRSAVTTPNVTKNLPTALSGFGNRRSRLADPESRGLPVL
jgi:hypothetical protein